MADKTWKKVERKIAELLGGLRVPITGRQRGDAPDIAHDWLSIEVKHRKELPEWIGDALAQAKASMKNEMQLPIAILHQSGQRHDKDIVCITMADFRAWFGVSVPESETPTAEGAPASESPAQPILGAAIAGIGKPPSRPERETPAASLTAFAPAASSAPTSACIAAAGATDTVQRE